MRMLSYAWDLVFLVSSAAKSCGEYCSLVYLDQSTPKVGYFVRSMRLFPTYRVTAFFATCAS